MIFSLVEVIKTKNNQFFIEWDLELSPTTTLSPVTTSTTPTPYSDSIDDYNFEIHWARDPATGFLPVLDAQGNPIEIDGAIGPLSYLHQLEQYDFNQDSYYKIKAIKKDLSESFFSSIVFVGMYFDGVHDTIRYAEDVLYRFYHGEPCLLIKRKSFGARCTKCWSKERQQRILSHCDICNNTGYIAGFYKPISVQISFDSDPKKSDSQKEFENVFDTKRARLSNHPIVRPKDIIVNLDDDVRYVITHVETTKLPKLSVYERSLSKQNYIVSQLLILETIVTNDDEYKIDIDNITDIPITDEGNTGDIIGENNRYYGSSEKTILTNTDILLLNHEACSTRANTHIYNCIGEKYIWICYPARFGAGKFTVDKFETTFVLTIQDITNETGRIESFYCYRSFRIQNDDNITVVVS